MKPNHSPGSSKIKPQAYEYTPANAQQQRAREPREDFVWENEIAKVLSPYWASRSES